MDAQQLKIAAATKALEFVEDGMRLGIGTGSTANEFIKLLGERVAKGLKVIGVPTSERSRVLCHECNIPLSTLEETPELDLDIDGADEIGPNMALVKGGGGALLREKIVAAASKTMIVIADETKVVSTLGSFPLPIEVNPFGLRATEIAIKKAASHIGLSGMLRIRGENGKPFVTDGGHYIIDASFGRIDDPESLSSELFAIPGVVEHGLFLNLAKKSVIAMNDGTIKVLNIADYSNNIK